MRRLFWMTVGAGLGGWAVHKAHEKINETRRALTPEGMAERLADRASGIGTGLRGFADDVRASAAAREDELNRRLGRTPGGPADAVPRPGFGSGTAMHEDETSPRTRASSTHHHHRKDDH